MYDCNNNSYGRQLNAARDECSELLPLPAYNYYQCLLKSGEIMWIVATDVFVSASEFPISVQLILVALRLDSRLSTVNVDISGEDPAREFLTTVNEFAATMRGISNREIEVTICFWLWKIPDWITVTFHSRNGKLVLHLKESWPSGHTHTSTDGDSITCDSTECVN